MRRLIKSGKLLTLSGATQMWLLVIPIALMPIGSLFFDLEAAQAPKASVGKPYKVAEVDITGAVSPNGCFLTYTDWTTDDLAVHSTDAKFVRV